MKRKKKNTHVPALEKLCCSEEKENLLQGIQRYTPRQPMLEYTFAESTLPREEERVRFF
jgi:hypothetical protein